MRPVLVAEAHYAPREQAQVLAGVVKARIESDLAFRIAGKMAMRLVDTGAIVHEGDALARLDDADFRLELEEAEAEQNSAKAALVQAEAEERRLTTLSKQGWTANADFDKARSAADQARAAAVRADRAVALTRNAIDYATLRADADGVITGFRPSPARSSRQARRSFAWRTRMSGRRRSRSPKRSSTACARRPRASSSGLCRAFPWRRSCASSRRRPTRRPAPTPRALRSSTRRPACGSA